MSIEKLEWHEIDHILFWRLSNLFKRDLINQAEEVLWIKHEIRKMAKLPIDRAESLAETALRISEESARSGSEKPNDEQNKYLGS